MKSSNSLRKSRLKRQATSKQIQQQLCHIINDIPQAQSELRQNAAHKLFALNKKHRLKMPKDIGLMVCKKCYVILNSTNSMTRIRDGKLIKTCKICNYVRRIVSRSLLVELSNPKTALFFIAFLPQFTHATGDVLITDLLVLGLLFSAIALCCDLLVVQLSHQLGRWMAKNPRIAVRQEQLVGLIFLGLGATLLLDFGQTATV